GGREGGAGAAAGGGMTRAGRAWPGGGGAGVLGGARGGPRRWRVAAEEVAGGEPHLGRVWHLRVYDAGLGLMEGRFAEAEQRVEEASRIGRRIEHPYARGVERILRSFLARERGDDAEVLRHFDPARPLRGVTM